MGVAAVLSQGLELSCRGQAVHDIARMHAELGRAKLVEQLIEAASKHVTSFNSTEVTLALDGLARLRAQPPTVLLDALAQQVRPRGLPD